MSLNISSLAPIRLASTVLATENLQVTQDVQTTMFRHSGNEFPSVITVPGAAPRVRFSTPAKPALDLIGLKALRLTTLDVYLATFAAGFRSASTDHHKYSLNTSAAALAYIQRIRISDRGIAMAEIECVLLSSDGMAYPLGSPTTGSLPTLASQPALHTLGTSRVDSTTINGTSGFELDFGANVVAGIDGNPGDGLLYPTVAQYLGGTPVINVEHGDPVGVLAALGYIGLAPTTSYVQWFRDYDTTNHVALTTGFSITAAVGRATPTEFGSSNQAIAKSGFRHEALSVSPTHPWAVGTGTVAT